MNSSILTFVIPVRHPANTIDWAAAMVRLQQTARSVAAQTDSRWRGIVVANHGAELLPLPAGFQVVRVNFPPNANHDLPEADREGAYEAFRVDKGCRVLAGLLAAPPSKYFMIVDDDDFVSNALAAFVGANLGAPGWYVGDGYVWSDGGRLLFQHSDFSNICGSSHIVRADLYDVPSNPEAAGEGYIKSMLGSHIQIERLLEKKGSPLTRLPFLGAIYRVAHAGSHSKSRSVLRTYVMDLAQTRTGLAFANLRQLKFLSADVQRRFGMLP